MKFSVKNQSFYTDELDYPNMPSDVVEIVTENYQALYQAIIEGCHIFLDNHKVTVSLPRPDIYHEWDDSLKLWAMTEDAEQKKKENIIVASENKKAVLRAEADSFIAPLEDAVTLGMATDEESASLSSWRIYRVLLSRIDTSVAPNIKWPASPQEQAN